ncbi:chromatin structure-remodeling complex protein SYD-like isoform X2 [Papaver somniferum]|uniref:chromatin structure-remodeling complex protein SYD-like isoform X2 n=1 Tax=Papaver somniferum TaxID=3469 RepID=UPI000E6FE20E|nr:chromatin structure-remodeling complex protein SYD-like isoform X2 [Papaver somniferum]
MAASQHVEIEAAKFLQKLIHESKDEPAKLATKLHVICQHMKASGKEHSLPYQVISRAMETVVNQHGLDIEAVKAARLPTTGGPQIGEDSGNASRSDAPDSMTPAGGSGMPFRGVPVGGAWNAGGSSSKIKEEVYAGTPMQSVGAFRDSRPGLADNEVMNPNKPPVGPNRVGSGGHEFYQGPVSQRSGSLYDHESPSSLDTRSGNSQERVDTVKLDKQGRPKEPKKAATKRKRAGATSADVNPDSPQKLDTPNAGAKSRKGKVTNQEHALVNPGQDSGPMEHLSSASSGMESLPRAKQESQISNVNLSEGDGSAYGVAGQQKGGFVQGRNDPSSTRNVWDQFKTGLLPDNSQLSRFAPTGAACVLTADATAAQSAVPSLGSSKENPQGMSVISGGYSKAQVGVPGNFGSYATIKTGFPASVQHNNTSFDNYEMALKLLKERGVDPELASKMLKERGLEPSGSQFLGKGKDMASMDTAVKSSSVEPTSSRGATDSEHRKSALMNDSESNISEKALEAQFDQQGSGSQGPQSKENVDTAKAPTFHPPVSSGMPFKEHHLKQLRAQCLVFLAFRNGLMPRKLHLDIALGEPNPREGGGSDGTRNEQSESKGKEISVKEPSSGNEATAVLGRPSDMSERTLPGSSSSGIPTETETTSMDTDKFQKGNKGPPTDSSAATEERNHLLPARRNLETEMNIQEESDSQATLAMTSAAMSVMNSGITLPKMNPDRDDIGNGQQQIGRLNHLSSSILGMNQQLKREMASLTGTRNQNEVSVNALSPSVFHHPPMPQRTDYSSNHPQLLGDRERGNNVLRSEPSYVQASLHVDRYPSTFSGKEASKTNSGKDVEHSRDVSVIRTHGSQGENHVSDPQKHLNYDRHQMVSANNTQNYGNPGMVLERSMEVGEENKSIYTDITMSPKYTTSEKWIMDHQKRKLNEERNWAIKQRKTEERMAVCFNKLKEVVSSSDDISTKTKSVIELKKLQLLQLQRRLRREFAHDFFKPNTSEIERLKTFKKHKHGRRVKQLEKFEQKMKEERQKRIRERQKEFFSEIEVHKERLEDWFKIKRERWKGFNKYVKEFHKKKERIHREKIDRIQREKINLLKNNDVEGYLRMVQDAKSDRVKQLLKETEKYLQKLGSKVQESKALARQFEVEMDENRASPVVEKNEVAVENEDENDQAEHYLESNQKYYLMAHSIKESIAEQPASLQGGKLREYQMNGLRWLVSLYNNHLNGILADEMGLGKTVQVISLICYLMETKNDRGPFLVVVPSSVLSGWVSELTFWAPSIIKIAYAGPPEERRKLFKERIVQQKFNVLLTTYEYLMNKHDRPKLSKIQWHYVIIDEGHRIKNASCKLNADLKHYKSAHRLLLTGTPLQNNLEELWALLNFLLPSIFNSSDDFSQWFNKPFESGVDTSPDDALLSEEENLLIINRLHQVLRPFVLRRLKHKVEHELPEKIERLVRCESSAYQKLLMKRVEDNLGCIGNSKGRSVHNSVMELRNICNHPYISQLHAEQVDSLVPRHYLPPIVRLCGKLEMLDRLLPKLKATDHRVLFFSTMTRLLDVMEEYLRWKRYRYLRLDGHTTGGDRGALIDEFNRPDSPAFIFLLSIRAGGVGVNLQAADTVIIFDTDWNPQVDLQAQARAHRIGQKKDVLVLRMETVHSVEEHVRAAAEHKLGVANQSITAGFFDNHTSAEDRREYLESLLRECKKEESASVLDDDALNDLLARSESEIETFELIDKQRQEEEAIVWQKLVHGSEKADPTACLPMPSRLVTDEDLKAFVEAMQAYEDANAGLKRKSEYTAGGLDTQYYGRGKRAREVRSYEDQMTEEEFEKMCQVDPPDSPEFKDDTEDSRMGNADTTKVLPDVTELLPNPPTLQPQPTETLQLQSPLPVATPSPHSLHPTETPSPASLHIVAAPPQPSTTVTLPPLPKEIPISVVTPEPTVATVLLSPLSIHPATSTAAVSPPPPQPPVQMTVQHPKQQPSRRGRGRPKRAATVAVPAVPSTVNTADMGSQGAPSLSPTAPPGFETPPGYAIVKDVAGSSSTEFVKGAVPASVTPVAVPSVLTQAKGRKIQRESGTPRSRAKKQTPLAPATLPEIIPSSAISKESGIASDIIKSSGASDVPTAADTVDSPLSRVQSGSGTPRSRAKKQTPPTPDVPTVTDAVDSPLSRVQSGSGTPRSRAKKQTPPTPGTSPEIISASAISKESITKSSGASDVPTVTDAVDSPLSRVQTAVTMASDSSSTATISQDKQELVSAQSGTSAPTLVTYEVNPIAGLHTLVELVPVSLPITSPVQEKHKTHIPKRKKVEKVCTSSATKPVISETTRPDRNDKIESAEFGKDDGVNVNVTNGSQEPKIDQTSTPVTSALAQDLMERRNLRMGSKNAKSGRKQKTTAKPGSPAAHLVKEDAGAGLSTPVLKPQSVSGGPSSLNLEQPVVQPVKSVPAQENVNLIPGNSTSIPELQSTAREAVSAQIKPSLVEPVESEAPQSNMSTADTPSISSPVNQKPAVSVSSRQTRFSAAKEKAREAPAVRRVPRKKDLARAAATAVNTSGPTTRGSLVGSLVVENSSKALETNIAKRKVEPATKSDLEVITKETLDYAVQSGCLSASPTVHIHASSSTIDEISPCVQEAEQIDTQHKLKNEGVQCDSRSGVALVKPALDKAVTGDDSGMQIDTNKDVGASISLTENSTEISEEHHHQAVAPVTGNVSKDTMEENGLDSLATDSPMEDVVDSVEADGNKILERKVDSTVSDPREVLKVAEAADFLIVVEDISKVDVSESQEVAGANAKSLITSASVEQGVSADISQDTGTSETHWTTNSMDVPERADVYGVASAGNVNSLSTSVNVEEATAEHDEDLKTREVPGGLTAVDATTPGSLVGSLVVERSNKAVETNITKCKVEIGTKSDQDSNTKEKVDCAVQSGCISSSSTVHIHASSSTIGGISACVQEAGQINTQLKLKNEGVQCGGRSGVVLVKPALDKAVTEGDSGTQIGTNKEVGASVSLTEKSTVISMEHHHPAVAPVVENVSKKTMEEDRLDSLAMDSSIEDIVDSAEADGNKTLEGNVDSSSISTASDPREVLKVTEATNFPNVLEGITKVDVPESQEVDGGNAKSLITSAFLEEGVRADIGHDTQTSETYQITNSMDVPERTDVYGVASAGNVNTSSTSVNVEEATADHDEDLRTREVPCGLVAVDGTTSCSSVGSLVVESSSKDVEINITEPKVETDTKSDQESKTEEKLDAAVQSGCLSAPSTLHIHASSSTTDGISPGVQEAEQINTQHKLKNEGVQCDSKIGVVLVNPPLDKAVTEGDFGMQIDINKEVGASISLTENSTEISMERHHQAVAPVVENVSKDIMEEDRLDSLATDSSVEDVVDSAEADGNKMLERSVDSSSISTASDPRDVLKVTEGRDFPKVVDDISKVDISESQEVAGGNAKLLITSVSVEEGVSADIGHDTRTSETHQITNSMDVPERADVYGVASAGNVKSSSTSVNVEEGTADHDEDLKTREVPGGLMAVDATTRGSLVGSLVVESINKAVETNITKRKVEIDTKSDQESNTKEKLDSEVQSGCLSASSKLHIHASISTIDEVSPCEAEQIITQYKLENDLVQCDTRSGVVLVKPALDKAVTEGDSGMQIDTSKDVGASISLTGKRTVLNEHHHQAVAPVVENLSKETMEEDRLDSLATDSPMVDVVDSVEADANKFLDRNVDPPSISTVLDPREVLKVTEATDFPNVVEDIPTVDVSESQEVAGGNAKSLIISASVDEGVSADIGHDTRTSDTHQITNASTDVLERAEVHGVASAGNVNSSSTSVNVEEATADHNEDLQTREVPGGLMAVDVAMGNVVEGVEVVTNALVDTTMEDVEGVKLVTNAPVKESSGKEVSET